jgi:hypothetical protein
MASSRSSGTPLVACGLAVAALAESAIVIGGSRVIGLSGLVLTLVASAAWAFVAFDARVERRPRLVMIAIGLAFIVAVIVPPRGSQDLWAYVMYGRTVSVHHTSPYVHAPRDFPRDAFAGRVSKGWRQAKSVYGPLFTAGSAVLTRLAGASALRARLAFQGLAAIGMAGALLLIWKAKHSARALAFVGLHPAVVTAVVNGGHNDALVGLAVVAGALLAARRHWSRAGFVLALGILVKASSGLGLLAVAAWAWRRDRRGAARLALVAGATTIVAYLPVGLTAVRAIEHAGNGNTRASVWDPISSVLHPSTTVMMIGTLLLATAAAWRWASASEPTTASLATVAAYLIGGVYVLPWYPVWALPTAAVERRSRLAVLVGAHAAFLVAVYEYEPPAHVTLSGVWGVLRSIAVQVGAWAALAVFVSLLFGARRRYARAGDVRSASPSAGGS